MKRRVRLDPADLRGAARLASDGVAGLTDLVEAVHGRIARVPGLGATGERTRGITGLVYKSVRGVTRLVGGSVDALLGLLSPALTADDAPNPQREAVVAALNGVLGDHLEAGANPLATPMALRRDGRPLALNAGALAEAVPGANGRLLVLLHGLCMNDLQWSREGHDHGAALARDAAYTPVWLNYNSGRHVAANGRDFADRLEQLVAAWPHPIERLVLLGHSMGGLVMRSALQHATQAGHRWPARLDDMVFLGTPHHGAPLERAGHWVDVLLGATPYAAPFARLGRVRSAGITDLRHGSVLDDDGSGAHTHLPLPSGVRCWALAATTGLRSGDLKDRLLGDGLVPLDSALGRHTDPARTLAFAPERQWVAHGVSHMALLNSPAVYAQLRSWLG